MLALLPVQLTAGGFIIVEQQGVPQSNTNPQDGRKLYTLECRSLKVQTTVQDQVAVTSVEQVFYNTTGQRLEGYFMFPIPKGSVIKDFRMEINGVMMQAEMMDATKARQIYEDIVRRMKDPALLEYSGQDLFRLRIFPIEPNSEKRISITYTELLTKDNGTYEYLFPLNTKKYSAAPLQNVLIQVDVQASAPLKTLYSPTHEIDINRKDDRTAKIVYESNAVSPDMDFRLYGSTATSMLGTSFLTYKEQGSEGFFFADISPGFIDEKVVMAKDVTLVLDVSGSMVGEKMDQARNALRFCVENLNPGDRFELIRFSTEAQALFGKRMPYTGETKKEALDFITGLKAIGGTNMDDAFRLALKEPPAGDRPSMIIFITDGKPTIGETDEERLLKKIGGLNTGNQRIFTFGVGYDLNTKLLDKLTDATHGYRTYVMPEEDIEVKVSDFFTKVSSPVLSDVTVRFADEPNEFKIFPKAIPDLFRGSSITLFGRYRKPGKTQMIVEGKVNGEIKKFTYDVVLGDVSARHDFIAPLWATRNVGFLLDQIRLHGETQEIKDEIVTLSREYGIITPYTSYLILEDEQIRTENRNITSDQQLFAPRMNGKVNEFMTGQKKQLDDLKSSGGEGSVRSSTEVQGYNYAGNLEKSVTKNKTMYRDSQGNDRDLAKETRNVNGRAMYQVGEEWVDVDIQKSANYKVNRVQFASKEYFDMANNTPGISQYLALGRNVRFVHNNQVYEVYD